MAFPLMVRAMRLSLESVDRRLEQAARTLGAGRFDIFCSVTLPLMAPGILTGLVLAFARSLGEFGATITFVSNIPGQTRTIPVAIYTLTQTPDGDAAALRLSHHRRDPGADRAGGLGMAGAAAADAARKLGHADARAPITVLAASI